jgi:hypothetical protein
VVGSIDIVQIQNRVNTEDVIAHARRFRRSPDFAPQPCAGLGRVKGSPRSRDARRRPTCPLNSAQLCGTSGVVFLQKPKGFANDFTRRVVASRIDFGADKRSNFPFSIGDSDGCLGHEPRPRICCGAISAVLASCKL